MITMAPTSEVPTPHSGDFEAFLAQLGPEGLLVYCSDNPLSNRLGRDWPGRSASYGIGLGHQFGRSRHPLICVEPCSGKRSGYGHGAL